MNVNNTGHIPKSHFRISETAVSTGDSNAVETVSGKKHDSIAVKSSKVLESLKSVSLEHRNSLIAEIKAKLNVGHFSTRQIAESVADSILNS